jgi:hypothetical protein
MRLAVPGDSGCGGRASYATSQEERIEIPGSGMQPF